MYHIGQVRHSTQERQEKDSWGG